MLFVRRRQVTAVIGIFAIGLRAAYAARSNPIEEAEIRKFVASIDANGQRGMSTSDFIFWSGAYKRPVVAHDDPNQYRTG
jgi:hypothetical protein